jgi:hypothetical protein
MSNPGEPAMSDSFLTVRSDHACFGCGDDNPIGLHLRFAPDGDGVKASFITSVLDEAMAWAVADAGVWAVTGEIRTRFRQPLKIGNLTSVVARVGGTRGGRVTATAELRLDRDHAFIATASAIFARVEAEVEAA